MEENNNIPYGWKQVELNSLINEMLDGGTPARSVEKYFGGDIPWVVIDDIKDEIYFTKEYLTKEGINACSSRLWEIGTIIISTGATIGNVGMLKIKSATKQGICGINFRKTVNNKYMMYLLKTMKAQLLSNSQGSTIREIRPSIIKKFSVIIPIIKSEQNKIAEILTNIDKAISQTEAIIEKQKRIKIGLIQDLLTNGIDENGCIRNEKTHQYKNSLLGRIPKEWAIEKLNDCINKSTSITYGIVQTYEHIENGIPVLRTVDLKENGINSIDNLLRTKKSISDSYKRTLLLENDIVCNVRASVGDFNLVSIDYVGCNTTRGVARICPSDEINNKYLLWFLKSYRNEKQMELLIKGTTFIDINIGDLRKIVVLLPSKIEQDLIAEKLEKIQSTFNKYNIELSKLKSIKTGLMQDLLSGKKRVTHLIN